MERQKRQPTVPGAKHRRRGQTRRDGMRRKKPSQGIFLLTIHVDWEFHPSLLTINRDRFDVGAFHFFSTLIFFFFSLSPYLPLSIRRNSLLSFRRYASQERRAAVEQRTDINNPEFPTDALIIRFQGPPILAGSRARKRIFLSSSRRARSRSPPPLPLLHDAAPPPCPPRPLTTHFCPGPFPFSLSLSLSGVVLHFLRSFPLPAGTPSASKFASRSKQRGTLPPLEMRVAYLWPKTVVRAYKESEREGREEGEGRPQMGHEKRGEGAIYDKRPLLYRPRNLETNRKRKVDEFRKSNDESLEQLISER